MNGAAEILPTHTPAMFHAAAQRAAELLRAGEVVAVPTETVYGLAANALDPKAVEKIYEVKGRPAHNPIIVHVTGLEMALSCVRSWPDTADKLARSFWPGPLTLVLPRSSLIPEVVTAGGDTVGIRWPSHPFIQELIRICGFPLAAPSANPSNEISPTTAEHVRQRLGSKLRLIVDGGASQVGIESTVLDLTSQPARILRPGMLHEESILAAIAPERLVLQNERGDSGAGTLRSPGLLRKHYAPRARLLLMNWSNEQDLLAQMAAASLQTKDCHIIAHTHVPMSEAFARVCIIPHDAEAFGRAIYSELHRCDAEGARLIIIEQLPDTPAWSGITDRLQRAAAL